MVSPKSNILLVGGGAVGTIAAVNIEAGGLGNVTLVARSNYQQVKQFGYQIESVDHGRLNAWRPSKGA
jgi:ketopantoate reductase